MTSGDQRPTAIAARITVADLADLTDSNVEKTRAILAEHGHVASEEDYIPGHVAARVAAALGLTVIVEPRDVILESLYVLETTGDLPVGLDSGVADRVEAIAGAIGHLDSQIEEASEHWAVARMPAVDRNILRLSVFELEHDDTPVPVVVSEGVRLAQTYSTEKSSAFVNGILAALAKEIRS